MGSASDLYLAIISNNVKLLKAMVELGANVNTARRGTTPLGLSVKNNREEIVKILVSFGAKVNQRSDDGMYTEPPLFTACRKGLKQIVKILLKAPDINVNQKDFFGRTPLWAAVRFRRYNIVKILLEHGADINTATRYNECPLYHSTQFIRNNYMAHLLIRSGCPLDFTDEWNRPPLYWCVRYADRETFVLLVRAGCVITRKQEWLSYDQLDPKWQEDGGFCHWIEHLQSNPRTLLDLSAAVVRRRISTRCKSLKEESVETLDIPKALKDLILLKD